MMNHPALLLHPDRYDDGIFRISREHGFLPKEPPLTRLSGPFEPLQHLLDAMPVHLPDGRAGLLGRPDAIARAVRDLPDLDAAVAALDPADAQDIRAIGALYRGYAFLASAYTLESAYSQQMHGTYGEARRALPPQVARPFVRAADALGMLPWLDYHYAYALNNWAWKDPTLPPEERMRWDNLSMCVAFSGTPDESGFILLHVHIDSHSGKIVGSIVDAVRAAERIRAGEDAFAALRSALTEHLDALRTINDIRKEMWNASRWQHYNDFRIFIMGIHGNTAIFGDGVVYEGVDRFGGAPQRFRGQTGAQDDVIPTVDVFSGVEPWYPDNDLTRYLFDLRAYRPPVVRRWLEDLHAEVKRLSLWELMREDPASAALLLGIVEQVYLFRSGHWQFVQKYILANTRYATATGGTPITSWIPNQIEATLAYMRELLRTLAPHRDNLPEPLRAEVARSEALHAERVGVLLAQIGELTKTHYDARLVYELNQRFAEGPEVT